MSLARVAMSTDFNSSGSYRLGLLSDKHCFGLLCHHPFLLNLTHQLLKPEDSPVDGLTIVFMGMAMGMCQAIGVGLSVHWAIVVHG